MKTNLLGIECNKEQIEGVNDWLQDARGLLFWKLIECYRDSEHMLASKPLGEMYAADKLGGKREVQYEVQIMKRQNNLAKENAFDQVLSLKEVISEEAKKAKTT